MVCLSVLYYGKMQWTFATDEFIHSYLSKDCVFQNQICAALLMTQGWVETSKTGRWTGPFVHFLGIVDWGLRVESSKTGRWSGPFVHFLGIVDPGLRVETSKTGRWTGPFVHFLGIVDSGLREETSKTGRWTGPCVHFLVIVLNDMLSSNSSLCCRNSVVLSFTLTLCVLQKCSRSQWMSVCLLCQWQRTY